MTQEKDECREAFEKEFPWAYPMRDGSGYKDVRIHGQYEGFQAAWAIRSNELEEAQDNYDGAMIDNEELVKAFRKRMPNDEWLNLNYPIQNNGRINMNDKTTEMANALLKASCEFKKVEIATMETVAKEAKPYWLHLANALTAINEAK